MLTNNDLAYNRWLPVSIALEVSLDIATLSMVSISYRKSRRTSLVVLVLPYLKVNRHTSSTEFLGIQKNPAY